MKSCFAKNKFIIFSALNMGILKMDDGPAGYKLVTLI
jgi:hypothetical protein